MNASRASRILDAYDANDPASLRDLGVQVYGNKGRMWSNTACITELDDVKMECNPRLAFNYCTVEHIGCPKCLALLLAIAEGVELNPFNSGDES